MAGARQMVGGADKQMVTREDGEGIVTAVLNPELVRCQTEIKIGDTTLISGIHYEFTTSEFNRLRKELVEGKPVVVKA